MKQTFQGEETWFFEEVSKLGESPNLVVGLRIEEQLYEGISPFQSIEVFETEEYGRVLTLDGLIQLSTRYEHVYHEMLSLPGYFYAKTPKKALIVGGGDGGCLRELVKLPLEEITLVDIDEDVTKVSKKYLPSVSEGAFEDPRVRVLHCDALKIIEESKQCYDLIVNDCTDAFGLSEALWSRKYYKSIKEALTEGGVAAFQMAYFKDKFSIASRKALQEVFPEVRIHRAYVGCFPHDEHCFAYVSSSGMEVHDLSLQFEELHLQTRFYSPNIHQSTNMIPRCYT